MFAGQGKWEQRDDGAWTPNLADKEVGNMLFEYHPFTDIFQNKKETKDSKMNNAGKITSKDVSKSVTLCNCMYLDMSG